ncbi:MAG TPA: hypothetical protein VMQ76_05355 [Terracidiphilus sp.]|jgi:hypothetical protein|nr:hypothetical protein [Terracidiphilus sp.]
MKLLVPPQSGSQQGITASRNRFGQYVRTRAIPVNPMSTAQGLVRARMTTNSAAWRTITAAQRAGWSDLGLSMVRTDSLGQSYSLQGNQAYASVNNNRLQCGLAVVADAPAVTTPVNIIGAVITLTAASMSIAYTATPLGAATYLAVFASPQRSAGRSFEADFRFIMVSTAAQASPIVPLAAYTAKFGVPVVGNRIFFSFVAISLGFESGPFITSAVVS